MEWQCSEGHEWETKFENVRAGQWCPQCSGNVKLTLKDEHGKPYTFMLSNVYYSPQFAGNLLSIEQLYAQHKIATLFRGKYAQFITPDGTRIPFQADEQRRYTLHADSIEADDTPITSTIF